ncbi:hypothetical protein TI01_0504 [Lysobacter sp. A03]|nr:hypothetical protein TI01_0504 [Lysobacter sp. A03]
MWIVHRNHWLRWVCCNDAWPATIAAAIAPVELRVETTRARPWASCMGAVAAGVHDLACLWPDPGPNAEREDRPHRIGDRRPRQRERAIVLACQRPARRIAAAGQAHRFSLIELSLQRPGLALPAAAGGIRSLGMRRRDPQWQCPANAAVDCGRRDGHRCRTGARCKPDRRASRGGEPGCDPDRPDTRSAGLDPGTSGAGLAGCSDCGGGGRCAPRRARRQ